MKNTMRLPNMRNLGIALRILLIANAVLACIALVQSSGFIGFFKEISALSTLFQPILLISLFLLYGCYPLLNRLQYWYGVLAVIAIVLFSATGVYAFFAQFWIIDQLPSLGRTLFCAFAIGALTLYYFNLHQRAYSPAIAEARLQALQARIRPHFLFNSINAVLSLIRSQPKQAEAALEDMADLFRVLMADNRELVPLAQEIALCRQYLSLEKLRLDTRLHVDWQIDNMPPDALIPPLILQPLIENAVYHGIEPLADGGTMTIQIYTQQKDIHLVISNPCNPQTAHQHGNKMALNNIKERLILHFDLEAMLKSEQTSTTYTVHIVLPHQTKPYPTISQ